MIYVSLMTEYLSKYTLLNKLSWLNVTRKRFVCCFYLS